MTFPRRDLIPADQPILSEIDLKYAREPKR